MEHVADMHLSLSHDWVEYQDLNRQVINQIEEEANNPVFVLVGANR